MWRTPVGIGTKSVAAQSPPMPARNFSLLMPVRLYLPWFFE